MRAFKTESRVTARGASPLGAEPTPVTRASGRAPSGETRGQDPRIRGQLMPYARVTSQFQRQEIVNRLTAPNDRPPIAVDEHFRRHRAAVVIGRHDRAVGARVENGEEIAGLRPPEPALLA